MITDHKAIYNFLVYGVDRKPHSILRSKSYEFHNRKIGLFGGNDTIMDGSFIVMHRDLRMRKSLLAKVSSSEFNTMSLK